MLCALLEDTILHLEIGLVIFRSSIWLHSAVLIFHSLCHLCVLRGEISTLRGWLSYPLNYKLLGKLRPWFNPLAGGLGVLGLDNLTKYCLSSLSHMCKSPWDSVQMPILCQHILSRAWDSALLRIATSRSTAHGTAKSRCFINVQWIRVNVIHLD